MPGPFDDLDAFLSLPRTSGLALSPDGSRLVTSVATLDPKRTAYVSALWQVDPTGAVPASRLTRSRKGETAPVFAPDGGVLFTSARPDPDGKDDDDEPPAALWSLPVSGEARVVGSRPGGVSGVRVARDATTVLVLADTLPAASDGASDEQRRTARKDLGVTAVLHAEHPVRHWDRDLGVGHTRPLAGEVLDDTSVVWRELTPAPGRALHEASTDLAPDGRTAVSTWVVEEPRGSRRAALVAIDTATGERRTLVDDGSSGFSSPRVSPDGQWVAAVRETRSTPVEPVDLRLVVLPLDGLGAPRDVAPDWDRWVGEHVWAPDGTALLVAADDSGRRPVFRIDVATGEARRLTRDAGHYTDLVVSPDGEHVYALRDAVDAPPAPVRLDARAFDQDPVLLPGPPLLQPPAGSLSEVSATAADGTSIRSWLVLPEGDGPHPLVLWVHGGPLGSWNGWSWRWCPWLLAAKGYAVLLPDPGLSTGYGLDMVRRVWGVWGGAPYTDLMALTDAALGHPAVDATRTAAMGGSFGGYMANWIAGHTDRFAAIVTHASLWDLEQFAPTTDAPYYWSRMFTPGTAVANSPSRYADAISSPMLVIHGDKDYRVPIGEGLRLWWDLVSRAEDPEDLPHRFLYFPDENHWVLAPQHTKIWYETVLAFLDRHVRDLPWRTPDLLR